MYAFYAARFNIVLQNKVTLPPKPVRNTHIFETLKWPWVMLGALLLAACSDTSLKSQLRMMLK